MRAIVAKLSVTSCIIFAALYAPQAHCGLIRTDPQREIELGRQIAKEIEKKIPLSTDQQLINWVKRVGDRLIACMQDKQYPYEFKVLADDEINAFCLPGGFVYVYEGLLAYLEDDDELAFVLAHEIAHASHRHWARHVKKREKLEILGILATAITGSQLVDLASSLATVLISASYSRDQEREADAAGLEHMWRAGFDPTGAFRVMKLFEQLGGKKGIKYLRSHPDPGARLARLKKLAAELEKRERPPLPDETRPMEKLDLSTLVGRLPEVELAPNELFPLSPGNEWTYRVDAAGRHLTYKVRVVSQIQTPRGPVYIMQTELASGQKVTVQRFTTPTQVWIRARPTEQQAAWQLEHITSLPEGEVVEQDGWRYEYAGTEELTLPCGVFPEAVKIRKSGGQRQTTYELWFVRGVGLVRRTCVDTGVTETLVSYKVRIPTAQPASTQPPSQQAPVQTQPPQPADQPASNDAASSQQENTD